MMPQFPILICLCAITGLLDARGYYASHPNPRQHNNKHKHNITMATHNDVTKPEPLREENSVERSPLLMNLDANEEELNELQPLFTTLDAHEVNSQLLVQLKEMNNQISGMRKSLSNLKYQSHVQYKMLKRMQSRCDTPQPQHMIRTAAMRLEPSEPQRDQAPACPAGFQFNVETHSCYLFGNDRITWRMAREKCLAMDADLVSIETNREQRYITDMARSQSDIRHCNFWTGATDQNSEGKWYWISNNKPLSYSFWNLNEPNNGSGDEHCMHMLWVFGWSWNDARCNYDSACYICEIHRKGNN